VRLDHLLSKEQLAVERRSVARGPCLSDRGARMAETLVSRVPATADLGSTCLRVVEIGGRCGWCLVLSILLGPERTTVLCGCFFGTSRHDL
jgi:hypothetical protein